MPFAAISLALGVVRLITWLYSTFWSRPAVLERKIAWLELKKAQAKAERDRLRGAYQKIDETPKPDDPAAGLNDAWNKKP